MPPGTVELNTGCYTKGVCNAISKPPLLIYIPVQPLFGWPYFDPVCTCFFSSGRSLRVIK